MGGEAGRAPSGGLRSCACSRTGWGRHHHHHHSESDAESDADTESVVVDESADSVVWDAGKSDSGREAALKHARRCWLSTGTKVATAEER